MEHHADRWGFDGSFVRHLVNSRLVAGKTRIKESVFMLPASSTFSHFMPPEATEVARQVDTLYGFLLVASLISCILVIGGMIWFAAAFRRKGPNDKTPYISHNTTLEFLWSFIPFVIFMVVFVWGWVVYSKMRTMPEDE